MLVHVALTEPRPTCLAPLQKAIFSASLDLTVNYYWRHWDGEMRGRPLSVRLRRKWWTLISLRLGSRGHLPDVIEECNPDGRTSMLHAPNRSKEVISFDGHDWELF